MLGFLRPFRVANGNEEVFCRAKERKLLIFARGQAAVRLMLRFVSDFCVNEDGIVRCKTQCYFVDGRPTCNKEIHG